MRIWNTIALLGVLTLIAALAAAQPTPFVINGWVNCTNGDPVNNPNLTIRNVNTSETFVVETNVGSNYYQVMTSSLNVSAGNVSNFSVNGDTPTNRAVTSDEMDAGGFEYNITLEFLPGDVSGDGKITSADAAIVLQMAVCGGYDRVADVNNDKSVTSLDALMILQIADGI